MEIKIFIRGIKHVMIDSLFGSIGSKSGWRCASDTSVESVVLSRSARFFLIESEETKASLFEENPPLPSFRAYRPDTRTGLTTSTTMSLINVAMSALLMFALIGVHVCHGASLTFTLPYGQRKCFNEELPISGTVRGTIHVSSGAGDMTLDLFVSDSRGTVQFHKSDVNSIKFSFDMPHSAHHQQHQQHHYNSYAGTESYRFCIVNQVHPQASAPKEVSRRVTLDISFVSDMHSEQVSKLAKSEHAEKLFSTFASVSSDVDGVIRKLDELRARELELTQINENTSSTILTISVLASLFTILTGVVNVMSLKSFFKRKKLA